MKNGNVVNMTMEYYSTIEKNKMINFAGKWWELEAIMLPEVT